MPRTKQATAKKKAATTVKKAEQVKPEVIKDLEKDVSNFEFLKSLSREEYAKCLEYIFLLREIHGISGFLRSIKAYKNNYDACWQTILDGEIKGLFLGRGKGFLLEWLTPALYGKLLNASVEQVAQFLTYFNITPYYRKEMLVAKKHRVVLAGNPDKAILEWLKEK